jgi:hypothetical protein
VNPQKSQFPAHGLGRASCACLSTISEIPSLFHAALFTSFNQFNLFSRFPLSRVCLLVFSVFLSALSLAGDQASAASAVSGSSSGSSTHGQKFRISDPNLIREAIAGGADLIADYGAFQVFRAHGELARKLAKDPNVEDLSVQNLITLHAVHLNTSSPDVQAVRKPLATGPGKRLHLVQFAGPVKPEWRAELEKTGVKIIDYIPNNTKFIPRRA